MHYPLSMIEKLKRWCFNGFSKFFCPCTYDISFSKIWFGSFFWRHINLLGLFNAIPVKKKKTAMILSNPLLGIKGFIPFPMALVLKCTLRQQCSILAIKVEVEVHHTGHLHFQDCLTQNVYCKIIICRCL